MGASGEDRRTYAPSQEEVLAAVKSLGRPSSLESVAAAVDALRRSRDRLAAEADGASCASVEAVSGLLQELDEALQVKGYPSENWVALGVRTDGSASRTKLWWSLDRWRQAAAARARRDEEDRRREEARREEDLARRQSPVRSAVESVLEERRWWYRNRHRFEGPGAG
ncbi:hypothetical protein OHB36_24235 [Streptomyces sp. NBC_00320]|uniref:hypothetical protein n=1 Tax=Streptomyces sp. NBC_00320 TaxID=2975711 RepID=UPI00224F7E77|nr:hypothetical protein [Streptomyces sp. NBC_00320]MCX5149849.1 hypothetical protein [Streptomyces sp. NBC_00320]